MPSREGGRVRGGWRLLLVGLVAVAGCGAGTPDPASGNAVAGVTSTAGVAGETAAATGAEDRWQAVRLDEMAGDRSNPEPAGRNPFRFGAPRAASRSGPGGGDPPGPSAVPVGGGGPQDLDPVRPPQGGTGSLPLTFIGFVESPGIGRVVVLTDGELVFHGRVGDVIDGRYRILRLGLESVDVEQVDGRGQQTLRLPSEPSSGS